MKSAKSESGPVFVGPDLVATHPELHHYTTFSGLEGITQSNALWATHFLDLNDRQEVFLLKEPLTAVVTRLFLETLRTRQRGSLRLRRIISQSGGLQKTASDTAKGFVEALYETTFRGNFAEPFVVSFCSHASDQPYERENGLLSQWRGYGQGGGVCIVSETAAIQELLHRESEAYYYLHLSIGSVHYALPDISVDNLFPDLSKFCGLFLDRMIEGSGMEEASAEILRPLISAAPLLKHQGFKEEREVRIIATPGSQEVYTELKREHRNVPPARSRPLLQGDRRRIALFDGLDVKLPIKRVIVGPSRNQHDNFDRARKILAPHITVNRAETPFIG